MGRSIDLYSYDYEKLKAKTLEVCKTSNVELVEKILLAGGNKIGDRYVILNQEMWEDCNCYCNVANVLEKVFKINDAFSNIFCTYGENGLDEQELINAKETSQIMEDAGLNPDDYYSDDDD